MRILFTGGSGKAGRIAISYLMAQGHKVVNADLMPAGIPGVPDLKIDLTDSGQVQNAMRAYGDFADLEAGTGMPRYDAVVHFAAIARILIVPDNETFRINTLSTYNVIDAALRAGVQKVVFASSETTYGVCFWDGHKDPDYIPVDEEHPIVPQDSYAMSKAVNETCARSFQARSGADIYGLRINNVMAVEDYETHFPEYIANPASRRRNFFAYIDGRDLGHMVDRCLAVDGLGYEVFNVSNDDMSVGLSNEEVRAQFYKDIPIKREMGVNESFYSNEKAKRLLGFQPKHSWRDHLTE